MRAQPQNEDWAKVENWTISESSITSEGLTKNSLIIQWPVIIRKAWELSENQMISEGFITNVVWTKS